MLTLTHRYRIYPDTTQEQQLIEWMGICRGAYNYALREIKDWCDSRKCLVDRCSLVHEYIFPADLKFPGETIFDSEGDHYQLLYVGWRGDKRDFGCVLHLDIKQGKIWIQHDGTEEGIANRLVEMGVPKQDIILAFHEPYVREFTGFGTGEDTLCETAQNGS